MSTDGTNEDPVQTFVYPTGQTQTAYTPNAITSTGAPMQIAVDNQYLSKDEFLNYPNGLKLSTSSGLYTSGVLDTILLMASGEVNRYARRHVDVQTIDQVYHGIRIGQVMPKLLTIPLNEGPIQVVNRIDIQVLEWFVSFSLNYLQVFPDQGFIQIVPFLGGGAGVPLPSAMLVEGFLGKVWVNYTFGYDLIPNEVKLATSLIRNQDDRLAGESGVRPVRQGRPQLLVAVNGRLRGSGLRDRRPRLHRRDQLHDLKGGHGARRLPAIGREAVPPPSRPQYTRG